MKSFGGLFRKDLLISRFWSVVGVLFTLFAIAACCTFAYYTGEPMAMFGGFVAILLFQSLFCPLMVISQLRLEGKTQLWLHNPNKGAILLLSKLASAAVYQFVSQAILFMFGLVIRGILQSATDSMFSVWDLFLANVAVFLGSVLLAVWVMFLWTVYETLRKYPAFKNIRWLVPLLIYNAYSLLEGWLIMSVLFENVQKLWSIPLKAIFKFHYQDARWTVVFSKIDIPIVLIVYYAVLAACLFYASGKLLDKKVEV